MNKLLEEEKNSNDYNYFLHEYKKLAEIGYEPAEIRYSEINNFIKEIENKKKIKEIDEKVIKLLNESKKISDYDYYLNEYKLLSNSGYEPARVRYDEIREILENIKNKLEDNKIKNRLHYIGTKLDKYMEIAKERPLTYDEKVQIQGISNNSDFVSRYQNDVLSFIKKIIQISDEKEEKQKIDEEKNKESMLKKHREDELKQAFTKRKVNLNIDIVSQVLNYTSGCAPEGCSDSTWYAYNQSNCIYHNAKIGREDSVLNLNKIDYRDVKINENGFLSYDGKILFNWIFSSNYVDPDRVLRGWDLIYSEYCSGNKRAF
jgi:hypothetical protein